MWSEAALNRLDLDAIYSKLFTISEKLDSLIMRFAYALSINNSRTSLYFNTISQYRTWIVPHCLLESVYTNQTGGFKDAVYTNLIGMKLWMIAFFYEVQRNAKCCEFYICVGWIVNGVYCPDVQPPHKSIFKRWPPQSPSIGKISAKWLRTSSAVANCKTMCDNEGCSSNSEAGSGGSQRGLWWRPRNERWVRSTTSQNTNRKISVRKKSSPKNWTYEESKSIGKTQMIF